MLSFTQMIGANTQKYNETKKLQRWIDLVKNKESDSVKGFRDCLDREILFHTRMQNPQEGVINLSGIHFTDKDRHWGWLNGHLAAIKDYFDKDGNYMLDNWNYQHPFATGSNEIVAIDFSGIFLGRKRVAAYLGSMEEETRPGWLPLTALIKKNISVPSLILKDTGISNSEVNEILEALDHNTKLTSIVFDEDVLSEENRHQLNDLLERNRQNLAKPTESYVIKNS